MFKNVGECASHSPTFKIVWNSCLPFGFDGGSREIVGQDGIIGIALCAHHSGTNLAETYPMSPSCSRENEAGGYIIGPHLFVHYESGAV